MNYIRRWGSIKENAQDGDECDFETFKEILLELSDNYSCRFEDNSDESFYCCRVQLPMYGPFHDEDSNRPRFNFHYLTDILGYDEDPTDFEQVPDPDASVRSNKIQLEKLSLELKHIISAHDKILGLFAYLRREIIPRFRTYSNFAYLSTGMGVDCLVISFEIDDQE